MNERLVGRVRPYVRDGVAGLSMAKQEMMLHRDGLDLADAYRDKLTAAQLRRREPASLTQRSLMLAGSDEGSPEVIVVAGLRCLGWNVADIARALAAAGRRGASIHAVDTGKTFAAATLDAELLETLAEVDETWRRGQTEDGRSAAATALTAKAEAARRAKLDAARPLWAKPSGEISGREIAKTVGISLGSLNKWLGPRTKARARESPES